MSHPTSNQTNRLAKEKSPYLLQHQANPVDWYPWGDAAFEKARKENKPIFLSIGYSTCHWCHVMERESFEDQAVAQFLKEHFVSIKVDREERPDVDKIYMTAVQALSGQGGWPLSAFLTPDLVPFYGGTYFPPKSSHGRPSFLQLLEGIKNLWQTKQDQVLKSAKDLHERLVSISEQTADQDRVLAPTLLERAASAFRQEFDPHHGGFGRSPKFPRPSQPAFLLRYGVRRQDKEAVFMVVHTCEKMARSGMYDQIGGGFARYSVDERWLVPHFEKMLYDNAQLVQLYLDAYLVSGERQHAEVARDIIHYVLRDMTHPDGGFYSAEDADSEGKEGKFYCWTKAELEALLTRDEFDIVVRHFGITDQGNFLDHSDPDPLPNQNVLSLVDSELSEDQSSLLESAKQKIFNARAKRVRPHLDDKVLSSWNGLMVGAIARAYSVLGEDSFLNAALKNLTFLRQHLWDQSTKTLYHRWRDGERDSVQLLNAYAYLLSGVIDLYEATLDPDHLEFALSLAESMIERFYDSDNGGFWQSASDVSDLIMRSKEDYDGAEPSGNSVAILALLKLAAICDRKDLKEAAEKSLKLFAQRLQELPQAVPHMLLALDFWLEEPKRAVVVGDRSSSEFRELLQTIHGVYQPSKVVLGVEGPVESVAQQLGQEHHDPVVALCTGASCQPPSSDTAALKKALVSG